MISHILFEMFDLVLEKAQQETYIVLPDLNLNKNNLIEIFPHSTSDENLKWILSCYLRGEFSINHLEYIFEIIDLYHKNKSYLHDIFHYQSFNHLFSELSMYIEDDLILERESLRLQREQIYLHTRLIFKDNNIEIIEPLNQLAYQFWTDDYFPNNRDYIGDIPKMVRYYKGVFFVKKSNNETFRLHFSYSISLYDSNLDFTPLCEIEENWEKYKFLEKMISLNGEILKFIPPRYITENLCWVSIANQGTLKHVPEKFKTREICLRALQQNEFNLQFIP